jgi:hypothetical protein
VLIVFLVMLIKELVRIAACAIILGECYKIALAKAAQCTLRESLRYPGTIHPLRCFSYHWRKFRRQCDEGFVACVATEVFKFPKFECEDCCRFTCLCKLTYGYRRQAPFGFVHRRVLSAEGISQDPNFLWSLACRIGRLTSIPVRQDQASQVVAVGLVCEKGEELFSILASYNLIFRGRGRFIPSATLVLLTIPTIHNLARVGTIDPLGGVHSEQRIIQQFWPPAEVVAIGSHRCICPQCLGRFAVARVEPASPQQPAAGSRGYNTCIEVGAPAIGIAVIWCTVPRAQWGPLLPRPPGSF